MPSASLARWWRHRTWSEPTGNLHSSQAQDIMQLFTQLDEQGTTIVQVTHSEANATCGSRILRLKDGCLDGAA